MKDKNMRTLWFVFICLCSSQFISANNNLDPLDHLNSGSWEYKVKNPKKQKDYAGKIKKIFTSYNESKQEFHWEHTIKVDKKKRHGFWLVLSPGENPKANVNEYAIFYGDAKKKKVTSYVYNGGWKEKSYKYENFIQKDKLQVKDHGDKLSVSMTIDTSHINSFLDTPDWKGVDFSQNIGIWFHPVLDPTINYFNDGSLMDFKFKKKYRGGYDINNGIAKYSGDPHAPVPEPSTLILLSLGLIGIVGAKKKKLI